MKKIAVIGAGIVGLATAYELRRQGIEVSVYDADAKPGQGTSKANGAQLSYSFVTPLATPDVLRSLHKLLLDRNGALRLHPSFSLSQWSWLLSFLKACSASQSQRGAENLLQLGKLSHRTLDQLQREQPVEFAHNRHGKLQVFENAESFAAARDAQGSFLGRHGVEQRVFSAAQTVEQEPSLAPIAHRIQGGLFTPSEEAGDCEQLCIALQERLQNMGVNFHFNTPITRLERHGDSITAFSAHTALEADTIILANGTGAQKLARPLGLNLGIYPLRGYSLTIPVNEHSGAPQASVSDIRNKVVYARIGDKLRVAGMIDIGVNNPSAIAARLHTLRQQVREFFPALTPTGDIEEWTGERPSRPTSTPIIGASPFNNLFLNVGHGALGFTLAFGSARLLTDILQSPSNKQPLLAPLFSL
ncbi:D-amino acid dehydrogenase [Paenalcaligenes suwonensis]|uniref:D-amino acid dehydrogenase n=1 Tax=Paenalcaligenes suwonensis TaxID=1202713 RepID=UPI00140CB1EB|nr:D-amino acid dehydrogenase [Paenalcaligenes suwonensis]NHC60061.1 FAD-dependent oxidoreductase [Paenalcaligenes suwonensis]